ncbi:ATP-dependent helicase [Candidatus Phytoplasma oryzae]|nr:UvrD-helicase domain-containing protein [Candidatus Phytoplasma oryzae]
MNKIWIKNLNEEQKKIIEDKKNSIYVLAGAGTGKTKTLISKIIFLLKELKIQKENILAITFTNNAAQEMKNRLQEILKEDFENLNIETFHSLSNKILKKNKNDFDIYFNIINEQESKIILKEQIKKFNLTTKINSISQIKNYISYYKTKKIRKKIINKINFKSNKTNIKKNNDFNHRLELIKNLEEIEKIYLKYQNFLITNNLMDFDDLIINNYELLSENKLISQFYQKKFLYILVDEFQDIDIIQYQIIKILGKNNILFVVGDPNQNIYNFRGSDIICSELFLKDFNAVIYRLFKNYRSTKNILSKSNLLIQNNYKNEQIFKNNKLESIIGNGQKVIYKHFLNSYSESKFIVEEIKKLINNKKNFFEDFAILYRLNDLSKEIENNLIINNIPYHIQGYMAFYNKKEIKVFLNYLNALINPEKNFYLKKIINIPSRKIGLKTIEKLEKISLEKNISLFRTIEDEIKKKTKISKKIYNFYNTFQKIYNLFKKKECSISNIIFVIDNIIGYSDSLNKNFYQNIKEIKQEELKNNLTRLQNIFNEYKFSENINNFEDKINIILEQITLFNENDINKKKNKIILSSIHKAKGLEFKIVFFIGLEEKIFLHNTNKIFNYTNNHKKSSIEEERRLAYVAITRAKKALYITSVQNRFLFGKQNFSKPICFIKEMKLNYPNTKIYNSKNLFQNKTKKVFYKIAENIKHNIFGIGKIISIKENIITISFLPPHGIKNILITHPSLQKL